MMPISPGLTVTRRRALVMNSGRVSARNKSPRNSRRDGPAGPPCRQLDRGIVGERGLPFRHVSPDGIRQGPRAARWSGTAPLRGQECAALGANNMDMV